MRLSPITNALSAIENYKHYNATTNLDYTTIADRVNTVSQTSIVKPANEMQTFPLTEKAM